MPTKIIESRHNAAFKLLKDLVGGGRSRRPHQAAWCEGARLCESYVELVTGKSHPDDSIAPEPDRVTHPILVASTDARLESIDTSVMAACAATWLLDAKLFAEISQVETSSGWGLVIPVPAQAQPIARRPNDGHASVQGDVVILDRLQDPGNAGTILRSAAASGISAVWAVTGTVDLWSPKVLRAAMGAHFVVEIVESMSEEAVLLRAHELGVNVLATANSSNAVPLYAPTLNLCDRLAWIFGQEGDGVSNTLLARSQTVVIPQSDQVESLNVAAAASVCLFETLRRKRFA